MKTVLRGTEFKNNFNESFLLCRIQENKNKI